MFSLMRVAIETIRQPIKQRFLQRGKRFRAIKAVTGTQASSLSPGDLGGETGNTTFRTKP